MMETRCHRDQQGPEYCEDQQFVESKITSAAQVDGLQSDAVRILESVRAALTNSCGLALRDL